MSSCSERDTRFPVVIWWRPSIAATAENDQQLPINHKPKQYMIAGIQINKHQLANLVFEIIH